MRQRSAASRKVVRFLSPDEEVMLRAALAARDPAGVEARANANAARREYRQAVLPDLPMEGYVDHLTPAVLTAINTGMQRGELMLMTWADIEWEARVLNIRAKNAKSGTQRHIPLNVEAMEVFQRLARQAGACRAGKVLVYLAPCSPWCTNRGRMAFMVARRTARMERYRHPGQWWQAT